MILSNYIVKIPSPENKDGIVLFSSKTASIITVSERFFEDIGKGEVCDEDKVFLYDKGFVVDSVEEETAEMLNYIEDLKRANTTYNAVLVLNMMCNLDCVYCFEGNRKGNYVMSFETADRFIKLVKEKGFPGKRHLRVTFYGGEPLLSSDLIMYISDRLIDVAAQKGLSYQFALVTNGVFLNAKIVSKLRDFGLGGAQVTIDGPRDLHDKTRPFKGGRGSFDVIVENLKEVCSVLKIKLAGNYYQHNYRSFPLLLDYLIDHGISPNNIMSVRFSPVTKESEEFALSDFSDGCNSIDELWLTEASIFLRKEIYKRGFSTDTVRPTICLLQLHDSIVINYDGSYYKCPGFLGRKDYCLGSLPSVPNDDTSAYCLDTWKNDECLSCNYLPLCFGGCRYMSYIRNGHMQGLDCRKNYYRKTLHSFIRQDISNKSRRNEIK